MNIRIKVAYDVKSAADEWDMVRASGVEELEQVLELDVTDEQVRSLVDTMHYHTQNALNAAIGKLERDSAKNKENLNNDPA